MLEPSMARIRQAVILAGGQGTRLRPLTLTTPKPLIPIHGKPFAEYLIELLRKNGIEEILFLTGYLAEQFPATLGDGSRWGVSITYSQSSVEDDTGTRIKKAAGLLHEEFLLMYGDNYWPLDLEVLYAFHRAKGLPATLSVFERTGIERNNMRYQSGMIELYDKDREAPNLNAIEIGFNIFNKSVIDLIPDTNANFERIVFPALIERHELAAYVAKHQYWTLTDIPKMHVIECVLDPNRKILFLDRDGVINVKAPKAEYITSWSDFRFLPGAIDALSQLSEAGYELYIITNQPGLARGMVTEASLADIHDRMVAELDQHGVSIKAIYHCPHSWDEGCECRKPKPGILYQAAREHNIDLTRAVFVGDDERDMEAGDAVGLRTILVDSKEGIAAALPQLLN
jgi:histidinol-phosphate phosphatase family protein